MTIPDMDEYLNANLADQWNWYCICRILTGDCPPEQLCADYLRSRPDYAILQAEVDAWLLSDRTTWCMCDAIVDFFEMYRNG